NEAIEVLLVLGGLLQPLPEVPRARGGLRHAEEDGDQRVIVDRRHGSPGGWAFALLWQPCHHKDSREASVSLARLVRQDVPQLDRPPVASRREQFAVR